MPSPALASVLADNDPMTRFERERRKASEARRNSLMAIYAEWLRCRWEAADPNNIEEAEEACSKRRDREDELALLIATTPAELPWMLFWKFEVLERALCYDGDGCHWTDSREIRMLAGIKADLMKFEMKERR